MTIGPPQDSFLLRTQQNLILQWFQNAGLKATEFSWSETVEPADGIASVHLRHQHTDFAVAIKREDSDFGRGWTYTWSLSGAPGDQSEWGVYTEHAANLRSLKPGFDAWVRNLNRERQAPDLWALLRSGFALQAAGSTQVQGSDLATERFSPEEIEQITRRLDEVPHYLEQVHGVQGEEAESVRVRVSYLKSAVRRVVNKVDYVNLLMGQVFHMTVEGIVPPNAVRDLFDFIGSALTPFLEQVKEFIRGQLE
jgi:hypothetical protein